MNDAPRAPAIIPTVSRPPKPLEVRLATIARALVIIATLAILAACYVGKEILAPILLALLLSLLLAPLVALIERTRMDPLGKEDSAKPMQFPALIRLSYFQMFADRQRGCRAE